MYQSQSHGFIFENIIKTEVFNLPDEKNNIEIHDIPCCKNKFNNNENISIKTTKSNTVYCGDILRFFNYDFSNINTIIIIKYKQDENTKEIENIYEINYNKECHKLLFGNLTLDIIKNYNNYIKSIPNGNVSKEIKKKYIQDKKLIQQEFETKIIIHPKVDSKKQRRVQCSIPNFLETLKKFIIYKTDCLNKNIIRNVSITKIIVSKKRENKKYNIVEEFKRLSLIQKWD